MLDPSMGPMLDPTMAASLGPTSQPGMPGGGGPDMSPDAQPQAPEQRPILLPPKLVEDASQALADAYRQVARDFADLAGSPLGAERYPLRDQVAAWNARDPRQDPYELSQQGKSPREIRDLVYPMRGVLLQMVGPSPKDRVALARKLESLSDDTRYDVGEEDEDPYLL